MKIIPDAVRVWCEKHGASSAYLAFAVLMLHIAKRGANKHVARENMISFSQALIPTELPHKLVGINAALVWWLRKSHKHVLSGWVGSFAAFFQGLAVLKFVQFYRENINAKEPVRAAMAKFIPDLNKVAAIGDLTLAKWLGVMLPLPQSLALSLGYPGVFKDSTVTYAHVGENFTTRLKMDVYKHPSTPDNAPILLYVHGGGWVFGKRDRAPMPLIYQVASRGWVVCSVDYRLSPNVAFPDHLIDIKRAIAYLRKNARQEFNADPDFIVVAGESAGGHLASLVALTPTDKSLQPGFEDVDTSVKACIDNYGVHDFKDRYGIYQNRDEGNGFVRFMELIVMQKKMSDSELDFDLASPISWLMEDKLAHVKLEQDVPPFLLSHGTHDTLVSFDDSRVFFDQLIKYRQRAKETGSQSLPVVDDIFIELPGAHHAFNYLMSPRALAYGDAVCVFLENLHEQSKNVVHTVEPSKAPMVSYAGTSRL